jgi:hypothetical protein
MKMDGSSVVATNTDPYSSMGYLYDNLCQMLDMKWNYVSPYNSYELYTNCAMNAAGDHATYRCGPSGADSGGFCPQMTLTYSQRFKSQDTAASYIAATNNYVDYWRSLYTFCVIWCSRRLSNFKCWKQ